MSNLIVWMEDHPGIASWAQMVGSLVALIVAIGVPVWERRLAERAARLAFRGPILLAIQYAAWHLEAEQRGQTDDLSRHRTGLQGAAQTLRALSMEKLSPRDALSATEVLEAVTSLIAVLDDEDFWVRVTPYYFVGKAARDASQSFRVIRHYAPHVLKALNEARASKGEGPLDYA
jgi:hypothetical protein